MFKPTYLYVKIHNSTGLKYFGKTIKNPNAYLGSGKHWLRHLKVHGTDISTNVIGYYTDREECINAAKKFSIENNIVESTEWANLCPENGTDGGYRINNHCKELNKHPRTQSWNKNISKSKKGRRTVHKPVKIGNLQFDAIVDAAKHFNKSEGAIHYWIKIGRAIIL